MGRRLGAVPNHVGLVAGGEFANEHAGPLRPQRCLLDRRDRFGAAVLDVAIPRGPGGLLGARTAVMLEDDAAPVMDEEPMPCRVKQRHDPATAPQRRLPPGEVRAERGLGGGERTPWG